MERFAISEVYAPHNMPNVLAGMFYTTPGPIMAVVDTFEIHVAGQGGHAAYPHETKDPVAAAVGIVDAIQTIASRNHFARQDLVVSVTQIHAGSSDNITPQRAYVCGTYARLSPECAIWSNGGWAKS